MQAITLVRHTLTPTLTMGSLYLNGRFQCYTLEDADRIGLGFAKIYGKTAIPSGISRLAITPSQRFKRDLPLVKGVPGFTGIRIHPGNTEEDTSGCILVGNILSETSIHGSRASFAELMEKLEAEKDLAKMFMYVERISLTRNMEDTLRDAWREDLKGESA